MNTRIVSCLVICAAMAMIVPEVQAQRSTNAARQQSPGDRPAANRPETNRPDTNRPFANRPATPPPSHNLTNLPTSPILPMTNPVAPMTSAPVQPFIRYGGTPTVVIREPRGESDNPRGSDRRRGNREVPVVLGGVYLADPNFYQYQPQPTPRTIPGPLPTVYRADPDPIAGTSEPGFIAPRTVAPAPETPLVYHSEPNVIITPPAPPLTVEPPPIGMLREDVLARYGRPWGTISTRGSETFYFDRGLVVVIQNGRVAQIK